MAKKVIFIEQLDSGYIITENSKKRALSDEKNVKDFIIQLVMESTHRFSHQGIKNMQIELEVNENIPDNGKC